jgi:hypothetical protein
MLSIDEDLDRAALTIAYAIANPCKSQCYSMVQFQIFPHTDETGWDATRFAAHIKNYRPTASHGDDDESTRLAKFFHNPNLGNMEDPAVVIDLQGRILVWYLPHIFHPAHVVFCIQFYFILFSLIAVQGSLNTAVTKLQRPLAKSILSSSASWRQSHFKPPTVGGHFGAGTLDLSPGWFQQSKEVFY